MMAEEHHEAKSTGEGQPKRNWNLLVLVSPTGYRWTVVASLAVMVALSMFILYLAPKLRTEHAVGDAGANELGSAWGTCAAGVWIPATILIVTFGVAIAGIPRQPSQLPERIYRLQGILVAGLVLCASIWFVVALVSILVFADYELPDNGTGAMLTWEQSHPCHMRLLPRIQELCTSISLLMMLALALGLFSQRLRALTPEEERQEWVAGIKEK